MPGFSVDLCDGFYQFTNEFLAIWFGFYFEMSASKIFSIFEVETVAVLDEATGEWEHFSDETMLSACFGGPAMGWSWALFFCHDALSLRMSKAMEDLRWPASMVGAINHSAHISRQVPVCAPYVDNANIIAVRR